MPSVSPTSGARGSYVVEIDALDVGSVVPTHEWVVHESRQGWTGFCVVDPGYTEFISRHEAFRRTLNFGLRPEAPVALGLWAKPAEDAEPPAADAGGAAGAGTRGPEGLVNVRTWPSVVTEVSVPSGDFPAHTRAMIFFVDPMRFLLQSPIWGAYKECSPGELLGGALSLAAGGDGRPTLTPALAGLPTLRITESLRESTRKLPYVIAVGEPLGRWLASVFGRLGIRAELIGRSSGRVDIFLRDGAPAGKPVEMTLLPGSATATNAVLTSLRQTSRDVRRGALLDGVSIGESQRIGPAVGPVGKLIYGTGVDRDEADYLAEFEGQRSALDMNAVRIVTAQPGLHPGRMLRFANRSVSGAIDWQVARVWHGSADGRYRNSADLVKGGVAWRPDVPQIGPPVTVTGLVDDGRSTVGSSVSRDRLSRVPVLLGASASDLGEGASEANAPAPAPVQIDLPVTEPMAGGVHGFVPSHRQGDACRISVHHPMWAEVSGFVYGYRGRVGQNLVDASAAMVVDNLDEKWSGVVFRPWADAEEEDEHEVAQWTANIPAASVSAAGEEQETAAASGSDAAASEAEAAQGLAGDMESEGAQQEAAAGDAAAGMPPPPAAADGTG